MEHPRPSPIRWLGPRLVVAALGVSLLAACMPNPREAATAPETRYPFEVKSRLVSRPVVFDAGSAVLSMVEKRQLDALVLDFMRTGGGILEIRAGAAKGLIDRRIEAVRRHLLFRGAERHEIRLKRVTEAATATGPLVVSYEKVALKAFNCTKVNVATADNPQNLQHPAFGCAYRSNIANMVSNPADLQRAQARQPADAARRNRVIQNYRTGTTTEAEKGEGESAGSIRDLGG